MVWNKKFYFLFGRFDVVCNILIVWVIWCLFFLIILFCWCVRMIWFCCLNLFWCWDRIFIWKWILLRKRWCLICWCLSLGSVCFRMFCRFRSCVCWIIFFFRKWFLLVMLIIIMILIIVIFIVWFWCGVVFWFCWWWFILNWCSRLVWRWREFFFLVIFWWSCWCNLVKLCLILWMVWVCCGRNWKSGWSFIWFISWKKILVMNCCWWFICVWFICVRFWCVCCVILRLFLWKVSVGNRCWMCRRDWWFCCLRKLLRNVIVGWFMLILGKFRWYWRIWKFIWFCVFMLRMCLICGRCCLICVKYCVSWAELFVWVYCFFLIFF